MRRLVRHRGPDDHGQFESDRGGLGHQRLSIIDLETGHQPITDESGKRYVVCNGEIYNFQELRSRLNGHTFTTRSDTEVIVHLYENMGPDCVKLLDGMFAFALIDGDELFLARDPLGIKPLYWCTSGQATYFASEVKALLSFGSEVQEFPPGHWFHSRLGLHRYFSLTNLQSDSNVDEEGGPDDLRRLLTEAVRKRLVSDVPVGVFLSGGLDSSVISALAVRESGSPMHSFAVGTESSADILAARVVAKDLGTTHHERLIEPDEIVSALPSIIHHLESFDAPLVESSVANFFLAQMAAEYVKVVLCGEGADELYAGYSYLKGLNEDELERELIRITEGLHNLNLLRCDRMTMAHALEARVPFLDIEVIKHALRTPTRDKIRREGAEVTEKWVLRRAADPLLPESIVSRKKQKFSHGSGAAGILGEFAANNVTDRDFQQSQSESGFRPRSKEEFIYYNLYRELDPDGFAMATVGLTLDPIST